jgi:hypothetical protein
MSQSTNPNENNVTQMTAPPSNPSPTAGNIPDLMKIGSIPVNTVQEVETSILEPVVKSNTFARFVFQNKGLLHSHSKIEIGLENAPQNSTLPLGIGAYALIKNARLMIGNQCICEVDDFNHYMAYRSLFVSNENNKEREQMTTGRAIAHSIGYDDRQTVLGGGESNVASTTGGGVGQGGGLVLDNGRDGNLNGSLGVTTNEIYSPQTWQMTRMGGSGAPLGTDADVNLYQLSLSELCPFLRHNQLPLYLIKEQVSLELTFSGIGNADKSSDRVVVKQGEASTGIFNIDTNTLRLISDHIFYPQELMIQYANANKVLNFTYADYRLSKYSQTTAGASSQNIRNVGGAGRIINKVIWGLQDESTTNERLLNGYESWTPTRDYTAGDASANGIATFNIKYNDTFEFPIDVSNPARHFHNINQAEGMVPFISREEYSAEGVSLSTRTWWGSPLNTNLRGKFFHHSQRLTSQERINSRGIELYFRYEDLPAVAEGWTQRVWLEVMRTATIANGYTECYFA